MFMALASPVLIFSRYAMDSLPNMSVKAEAIAVIGPVPMTENPEATPKISPPRLS